MKVIQDDFHRPCPVIQCNAVHGRWKSSRSRRASLSNCADVESDARPGAPSRSVLPGRGEIAGLLLLATTTMKAGPASRHLQLCVYRALHIGAHDFASSVALSESSRSVWFFGWSAAPLTCRRRLDEVWRSCPVAVSAHRRPCCSSTRTRPLSLAFCNSDALEATAAPIVVSSHIAVCGVAGGGWCEIADAGDALRAWLWRIASRSTCLADFGFRWVPPSQRFFCFRMGGNPCSFFACVVHFLCS